MMAATDSKTETSALAEATSQQTHVAPRESSTRNSINAGPRRLQLFEMPVWRFSYRDSHIDHVRAHHEVLRYVVRDSKTMREALNKRRRTRIEPLTYKTAEGVELRTSDLYEMAERTALQMLRELHRKVADARVKTDHVQAPALPKRLGQVMPAIEHRGNTAGLLLHAGPRAELPYCIELLDESGVVRRIVGIDLARALTEAAAVPGDRIRVVATGKHQADIIEQQTGTHGQERQRLRCAREIFVITNERSDAAATEQLNDIHRSARD